MSETVKEYLNRRIGEAMAEATRCPNCGPHALIGDPAGDGAWCPICGWSRPTVLPPEPTQPA